MIIGRAAACSTWVIFLFSALVIADEKDAKKQAELKWAKGVATDFLAAMTSGDYEKAEMLLSAEQKERIRVLPNWLPDARFEGLGKGHTITDEQIAPDRDEASFKGLLQGEKREAPYSLRVVREKNNRLWRVAFFCYGEVRDISPQKAPPVLAKNQDDAKKLAELNKAIVEKMRVVDKRTSEKGADFEYPKAKKLDQRTGNAGVTDAGSVYQSLCTTTDDLSKVAMWYDKKLASLIAGQPAGVTGEGDSTRRAINQDGGRPDLEVIARRQVSTRTYLVRAKSHTVSVVISRPPGEALTVISLTYMPE